jgi:hypothetical protein
LIQIGEPVAADMLHSVLLTKTICVSMLSSSYFMFVSVTGLKVH